MIWKHITGLLISGIIIGTAIYDLIADVFGGNESTISKIFLNLSRISPFWLILVIYALGMLTGHFFLPQTV